MKTTMAFFRAVLKTLRQFCSWYKEHKGVMFIVIAVCVTILVIGEIKYSAFRFDRDSILFEDLVHRSIAASFGAPSYEPSGKYTEFLFIDKYNESLSKLHKKGIGRPSYSSTPEKPSGVQLAILHHRLTPSYVGKYCGGISVSAFRGREMSSCFSMQNHCLYVYSEQFRIEFVDVTKDVKIRSLDVDVTDYPGIGKAATCCVQRGERFMLLSEGSPPLSGHYYEGSHGCGVLLQLSEAGVIPKTAEESGLVAFP